MTDINRTACCGMQVIDGLDQSSGRIMKDICKWKYPEYGNGGEQAFLVFTDDIEEKNGERFAKFIKRKGLGELYVTPARLNPNSENKIKVWVWAPHEEKLMDWYKNHKKV